MPWSVDVKFSAGLKRWMSSGMGDSKKVLSNILEKWAIAVDRLIKQSGYCPVDTGRLRAGHTLNLSNAIIKYILNAVEYMPYVVYGTSKMAANNYPHRALLASKADVERIVRQEITAYLRGTVSPI
jgi:hypothetical protein